MPFYLLISMPSKGNTKVVQNRHQKQAKSKPRASRFNGSLKGEDVQLLIHRF